MPPKPATQEAGTALDAATPNPHTQYSLVFLNEQNNRLHAFGSGIDALGGERASRIATYEADREKRRQEFETAQIAAEKDHVDAVSALNRRIADLALGADMARAAVAMYEQHNGKPEGAMETE